jgi:uncharacterized protein
VEARPRIVGIDVARAVALLGVVAMNWTEVFNEADLATRGVGEGPHWLERALAPFEGPLTTRFAATFVMLAGIGVTLLTARARRAGDVEEMREDRWRLRRRGLLLFAVGYAFEWIWPGQILSYYGAYLTIGSFLTAWPPRRLLVLAGVVGAASALLLWPYTSTHDWSWLLFVESDSPRNLVFNTVVNGTHPLLPWLALFLLGMAVGHLDLGDARVRLRLAVAGLAALVGGYAVAAVLDRTVEGRFDLVASTRPFPYLPLYVVVTAGSSVLAIAVLVSLAERFRDTGLVRVLALAGQMTLSIYLLHALVANALVDRLDLGGSVGLVPALLAAVAFWVLAVPLAAGWRALVGIGPAERIYRSFGG